ncbi:MAG: hypothetical protein ACRDEA_06550 [Microcystaceae cyanobacterium]
MIDELNQGVDALRASLTHPTPGVGDAEMLRAIARSPLDWVSAIATSN